MIYNIVVIANVLETVSVWKIIVKWLLYDNILCLIQQSINSQYLKFSISKSISSKFNVRLKKHYGCS